MSDDWTDEECREYTGLSKEEHDKLDEEWKEHQEKIKGRYNRSQITPKPMVDEIPECPIHKLPMILLKEGKIMKTYACVEKKCNEMIDVIIIAMKNKDKEEKKYKYILGDKKNGKNI